jgi:hypothetical protein
MGLLVRVRCAVGPCPAPVLRGLFDLQALGALPRLFTTAVLLLVALSAAVESRRDVGRARLWWSAIAIGAAALTVAKAVSAHSSLERDDGRITTLVGGATLTLVALALLRWTGLRWSVHEGARVTGALACYAVAALALDQLTAGAASLSASPVLQAVAVFLEEGGEAGTALAVLATVAQAVPPRR